MFGAFDPNKNAQASNNGAAPANKSGEKDTAAMIGKKRKRSSQGPESEEKSGTAVHDGKRDGKRARQNENNTQEERK